jgi:hypothetical protein
MSRLAFLLLLFGSSAQASSKENPYDSHSMCNQLYMIATSALTLKEQGLSKDDLLKPLPSLTALLIMPISKEKILAQHLHRIADEIFKLEDLEKNSYSAFTAETRHRQLKELPVVDNFENVYPKLLTCKALHSAEERIACGMAISSIEVKSAIAN